MRSAPGKATLSTSPTGSQQNYLSCWRAGYAARPGAAPPRQLTSGRRIRPCSQPTSCTVKAPDIQESLCRACDELYYWARYANLDPNPENDLLASAAITANTGIESGWMLTSLDLAPLTDPSALPAFAWSVASDTRARTCPTGCTNRPGQRFRWLRGLADCRAHRSSGRWGACAPCRGQPVLGKRSAFNRRPKPCLLRWSPSKGKRD